MISAQKQKAALLIAEGECGLSRIADTIGVARGTLYNWQADPEFDARVQEHAERLSEQFAEESILRCKLRKELFRKVAAVVGNFTDEDMGKIKKNPISAINLYLRPLGSVETAELRRQSIADDEEFEDEDDYPFHPDLPLEKVNEIIERIEKRRMSKLSEYGQANSIEAYKEIDLYTTPISVKETRSASP